MSLAVSLLTSGRSDSNAANRTTAAIAPALASCFLLACFGRETTAGAPAPDFALSANYGTWSFAEHTNSDSQTNRHTLSVFVDETPSYGSDPAFTMTPGENCNRWGWLAMQITGCTATVVQAKAAPVSNSANPTLTLDSPPDADNIVVGFVASVQKSSAIDAGTGFTKIGDTSNGVTQTVLQAQYRTGSTSTDVPFANCGTFSNIMVALELEVAAAPTSRVIRARSANTADSAVLAEVDIGADSGRWHTGMLEIDVGAGKLRLHVAGETTVEANLTGTLATQTGNLVMGATLASGAVVSDAVDLFHGTMISFDTLPSAELLAAAMQRAAGDLAPVISDWSEAVAANATSTVALSSRVQDPYQWGWAIDATTTPLDDGCTVAIVGSTLQVTSLRSGAARVSVVVRSLAPLAPKSTAILTLSMTATGLVSPIGVWNAHGVSPYEDGHQDWNDDVCKLGGGAGQGGWDDWNNYMMRANETGGSHRKVKVIGMWPRWTDRPPTLSTVGFGGRNPADGKGTKGLYRLCREEGLIPSVSLPLRHLKMPNGSDTPAGFGHLLTSAGMDQYYRDYCTKLKSYGYTVANGAKIIMRMAWEAQSTGSFGHSLNHDFNQYLTVTTGTPSNPYQYNKTTGAIVLPDDLFTNFIAAWERIARILKNELGDVCVIDWCYFHTPHLKLTSNDSSPWLFGFHPDECLPDLSLIDILSADAYDGRGGTITTTAQQDTYMNHRFRTTRGNGNVMTKSIPMLSSGNTISVGATLADFAPTGMHQWYLWSESKGKTWALPEWGCKTTDRPNGEFVRMIYRYWTEEWVQRATYHYYFNRDVNELRPDGRGGFHPNSIAAWRETFGARAVNFPVTPA